MHEYVEATVSEAVPGQRPLGEDDSRTRLYLARRYLYLPLHEKLKNKKFEH